MELAKLLVESLESHLKAFAAEMDRAKSAEEAAEVVRRAEESWEREPLAFLEGKTLAAYLAELDDAKSWLSLVNELAQRELMPVPVRQGVAAKGALLAPYLVELAEHQPEFTALGDAVVDLLGAIGEPARAGLYSLCRRYQHDVESVPYSRAVEILVKLPRQDETWTCLQRGLQEAKGLIGFYAALAGDYGDQRAVLPLNTLLEERRDLSEDDRLICLESIELCDGIPSAAGKAAAWSGEPESEWSRVGRNDPCPCGSGLKFKKCHGK